MQVLLSVRLESSESPDLSSSGPIVLPVSRILDYKSLRATTSEAYCAHTKFYILMLFVTSFCHTSHKYHSSSR